MKRMKEKVKCYLALSLTVMLIVGTMNFTVLPVWAESESVKAGAFTLKGENLVEESDYTYVDSEDSNKYGGVLTINSSNPITISNTTPDTATKDRIVVATGITANITLENVNIDLSSLTTVDDRNYACAFEIKQETTGQETTVNLTLSGSNTLKSGYSRGGLEVSKQWDLEYDTETGEMTEKQLNSVLTINAADAGTLYATGGDYGAGIGSRNNCGAGTITINGGTIVAEGGQYGAGIGGGSAGSGGIITINGGNVTATGKVWAPGIGGSNYSGETITITGGHVVATGGTEGACIGGRYQSGGGSITISGGTVITTGGANGIGDGASLVADAVPSTFSTGTNGNAIIKTSNITGTEHRSTWSGVIFEGIEGMVYGTPTLNETLEIGDGETLTVPAGATLNIAEGATLSIAEEAALTNQGTLKVANENSITGSGKITGEGSYSHVPIGEEAITVPENLVYTGADLTQTAKEEISIEVKNISLMGREFVTATDWVLSMEPDVVKRSGTYTVTYTNDTDSVSKTFEVKKAQSPANPVKSEILVPNTIKTVSEVSISENTVSGNDALVEFIWDEASALQTIPAGESVQAKAVYAGDDAECYENTSVNVTISRAACEEDETILFTGDGEKAPTCTEDGIGHTVCALCGDVIKASVSVNATGHIHTVIKNEKEATCAQAGYTGDTWCNDCESYTLSGNDIPKSTTHTWNNGVVTKEATTTQTGVKTYTCTVCQTTKTEAIPKLSGNQGGANQGGNNQTPGAGNGQGAGEIGNNSDGNGQNGTDPSGTLPAKGTVFEDAKTGASYKITVSDAAKGTVDYVKPLKKTKTVTISKTVELNGVTYKVTGIAANAFKNNTKLTKVTIGSNVTKIGQNAFNGCTKLNTVTIGKNVKTIDAKAFYKCKALKKITIPSKVNKIGKQAFQSCSKLKNITIKTTKLTSKNVGSKAFKGTPANAKVKVPKSKVSSYKKFLVKKGISKKAEITK